MGFYRHRMPDREIQAVKDDLDAELTAAQYWEAQASMWHQNYREAMHHEDEAKRYKEALSRIKSIGYGTKERVRQIVLRAIGETE